MNVSSKQRSMQKGAEMSEPIATGSGNVYENLGISDAAEMQIKAQLMGSVHYGGEQSRGIQPLVEYLRKTV